MKPGRPQYHIKAAFVSVVGCGNSVSFFKLDNKGNLQKKNGKYELSQELTPLIFQSSQPLIEATHISNKNSGTVPIKSKKKQQKTPIHKEPRTDPFLEPPHDILTPKQVPDTDIGYFEPDYTDLFECNINFFDDQEISLDDESFEDTCFECQ